MFADKKQKAIEQFHEYLAACDTLYATKKQGGGDCELSANNLEKKWEEWQTATNTIYEFLLKGVKYHHQNKEQKE